MTVSVGSYSLDDLECDLLLAPSARTESGEYDKNFEALFGSAFRLASVDFTGKPGEWVVFYPEVSGVRRVALLGWNPTGSDVREELRRVAATGADVASRLKVRSVAVRVPVVDLDVDDACQAVVEGFMLAGYRFTRYRTGEEARPFGVEHLVLLTDGSGVDGAEQGRVISEAVYTARDLVNLSPDEKTPGLFGEAILQEGRKWNYEVEIWGREMIEAEGFRGLLAVNRGSTEDPAFAILRWNPPDAINDRPIVLVGKGIVFDTGGLSLKPTKGSMDQMKADMAGAAAVIGAFQCAARLNLPVSLVGLIPITDNRPGENAFVPGDVIRMHSGKTVEVLNTDAEGRLVLADALSFARRFEPLLAIDLATLTGAAVVALGTVAAPIMTNNLPGATERLEKLERAGHRSGDRVHPMPMYDDYAKALESDVADLKNVGGREAGAITGAKFLEHFVSYPWIHIDIAGPAFLERADSYRPSGGTGFGVRLLADFLLDFVKEAQQA